MNRYERVLTRRVPSWALLALLGGIAVAMHFSTDWSLCGNTVENDLPSPDGSRRAVLFERNCGVGSNANLQLAILPRSMALPDEPDAVFVAEVDRTDTLSSRGPLVTVIWAAPGTLEVHHSPGASFIHADSIHEGTVVRYVRITK